MPRLGTLLLSFVLLTAGCAGSDSREENAGRTNADARGNPLGPAPAVRVGPLSQRLAADLNAVFGRLESIDRTAVRRIGASGDARVAWLLSDLLRFVQVEWLAADLVEGFERLTGARLEGEDRQPGHSWRAVTDLLIAWDLPAPPGYVRYKARLFTLVEPGWAPFFEDRNADIDWGGVLIDDRPLGDPAPCPRGCIPALDDPAVTDAAGGSWYPDDALVFGVVVNGQARAYNGPIFPVGDVDPRLPVQEHVVGVIAPDGTPLAFRAAASRAALQAGKDVELADVHLELDGDGLRAVLESGARVVSHQAFWFAWSQFHPGTALWTPRG
jgi:hypothetical protein